MIFLINSPQMGQVLLDFPQIFKGKLKPVTQAIKILFSFPWRLSTRPRFHFFFQLLAVFYNFKSNLALTLVRTNPSIHPP